MTPQHPEPRTAPSRRVHAFTDDALGEHDAVALAAELQARRVSRRELVDAAVARTQKLDGEVHGRAVDRFASATQESGLADPAFFAGLPSFVKDNSDVAGLPTQQGTRAYIGDPAARDGDFARMFRAVGITVLGKTRLSEYGFSPSAEFVDEEPVRNPWDTDHVSGASSAGAAAFVSAGVVPLAHGNDGGGSIRIPAACCGLVGLKPTRGRVPSDASHREMPVRIVHDGVLTRTVRDTAAFLRESERVYRDLRLPPVGDVVGPSRTRLRVALVTDSVGDRTTDPETEAAVLATAELLEGLGHHVEPVQPNVPDWFEQDFLLYWSLLALALSTTGKQRFGRTYDRRRNDHLTQGLARNAARNAWRLPLAIARLRGAHRISERLFAAHDVVLTPTLSRTTPRVGWLNPSQGYETLIARILEWLAFTPLQNATGDPAISLPLGRTRTGLPIGVQLAAARGHDRRLLELAYEIEAARPFRRIQD